MKINAILVPTDFSEYSDRAFTWALEMADKWQASLELLHVVPSPSHPPMLLGEGGFNPANYEGSLRDEAQKQAEAMAGRAEQPGVAIKTTVVIGSPLQDICKIAAQAKSDLIVVGSHGRTGLSHVLLGSMAERVVRHVPCLVLVVGKTAQS